MLKVAIIDDEYKSRELVKVLLDGMFIEVVGTASNVSESIILIRTKSPDLLLLDVELGLETGFDLLEQAGPVNFNVIFITAHSHYALKAIKFSAIDYLLKPIDGDELKKAVMKAQERQHQATFQKRMDVLMQNLHSTQNSQQKLAIPTSDGLVFTPIEEIIYCEAEGAYTNIHTRDGRRMMVSKNLKEYEALLEGSNFFRVHNSYLINLNQITKYVKGEGGYVIMSNKASLDVSKRRKEAFLAAIALR